MNYGLLTEAPLRGSFDEIKAAGWNVKGVVEKHESTSDGLRAVLNQTGAETNFAGLSWNKLITSDCEATLDFGDAVFTPVNEGWGQSLELAFLLDDSTESNVRCESSMDGKGNPRLQSLMRRKSIATGDATYHNVVNKPGMKTAGRLRLVRQRDQIYCLFAESDSDKFEVFSQYSVGNARIKEVSVFSKRSDTHGTVSILLKSLTVKTSTAVQ